MRVEKLDDGYIRFELTEEYVQQYGITLDALINGKSYPAELYESLCDIAEEQLEVKCERDSFIKIRVSKKENIVLYDVYPKSNIVKLHNDYIEEKDIVNQWQNLFNSLADNKIYIGEMDEKEFLDTLYKLRTDREYIRQYLKEHDII